MQQVVKIYQHSVILSNLHVSEPQISDVTCGSNRHNELRQWKDEYAAYSIHISVF